MLDTATQQAIKVSLVTNEESLPELEKYLEVNYSGWRYVGEVFPWAYMTIAAIVLPQAEWTDEDTDVFDELQQERLLRSYDWSCATEQELAMRAPGQVIPALLGALSGLVGSDGYLTQRGACVCDETHSRNDTVCCICYARQVYGCHQQDYRVESDVSHARETGARGCAPQVLIVSTRRERRSRLVEASRVFAREALLSCSML